MNMSDIYDMLCSAHCCGNCPIGSCTMDCWFDFACRGITPTAKQINDKIKEEFEYGKKNQSFHPCHEIFGRDAFRFFDFATAHYDELCKFCEDWSNSFGPARYVEDEKTDPWIQKQNAVLKQVAEFVKNNL